jgi:hypothetical protein
MGVFYYIHSVALIEDLPLEEHYHTPKEFYAAADIAYKQVSSTWSLLRSFVSQYKTSIEVSVSSEFRKSGEQSPKIY